MNKTFKFLLLVFISLFISCTGNTEHSYSARDASAMVEGIDSILSEVVPDEPEEVIPDELDDFVVTSQGGYGAYVKSRPTLDSERLMVYRDGTTFTGAYTDKPHWIMIVEDNRIVGYIHDENVSLEYEDYGEGEEGEYIEQGIQDESLQSSQGDSQSNPDWLQGTWRYEGTYKGTYVNLELIIQGNRLIDKWNGSVEYDGPYHYDANLNIIAFNGGRDILPVKPDKQVIVFTGDLYYTKSSNNNSSVSNSSSSSSTYSFYNPTSVIDYLNHRTFECQGLRIKFSDNGFTVNGNYGGSAPVVKSFRENYAVIRVNLIPSGSLTFYVYPHQEKLVDTDGNTWRGYKSASYEH